MSEEASPPLHLTATRVAEFFRYGCERQLRYDLVPPPERGPEIPRPNRDPARGPIIAPRPGSGLLMQAGRRWERRKLRQLLDRIGFDRALLTGWTEAGSPQRIPADAVVDALREPGGAEFLVQPELRLQDPERFARRFGLDPERVRFAPAAPDLIRVHRSRDGRVRFQVIDIKASRDARISHFAQVAFYTFVLEEICERAGIDGGAPDTRWARVWTRDGWRSSRFPLGAYRHHVERFLREELPRIASLLPAAAAWHVAPRCSGCIYLEHCRAEADTTDDLARVAGITPLAKQTLHARKIRTTKQLAESFRRDLYTGCHALEANELQLKKRVQAIRYGKTFDIEAQTHLMAPREDVRLLLSAEGDPVTGLCFALGVRVDGRAGERVTPGSEVFLSAEGNFAAERAMLDAFLQQVNCTLMGIAEMGRELPLRSRPTVQLYVWDRRELALLRDLLERHLADGEGQPMLAHVLQLFGAGGKSSTADGSSPGVVLSDVVAALFALPIPYVYDLASVSAALQPGTAPWVHRTRVGYGWSMSSQVAFERIHNVWRNRPLVLGGATQTPVQVGEEIRRTVSSKLAALDSVLRAVRERAARADKLHLRAEPMNAGEADATLPDPALETLRLLTRMESMAEAVTIRALHALPAAERARRFECIRGMEHVTTCADGALVFEFDAECRDAKFRPGDFNLVLTNEGSQTLAETDRAIWKRRPLMVELVEYDLASTPPRVVLSPGSGFAKAEEKGEIDLHQPCVLDRAASDFNTDRIVATLQALAAGHGEAAFVRDILAGSPPADWPLLAEPAEAVFREVLGGAAAAYGRPVLNPDQERAWRAAFKRAVTLIWGPPGTGKTYLLGWMLIGFAAAARRAGRPCRILVSAATHRAITNVLARTARELEASGIPSPLSLFKLRGSGSEADAELVGLPVELLDDRSLRARLASADAACEPLIVGSTVWSMWKQMRAASRDAGDPDDTPVQPWFDLIVIDEASQMKVPEALIALSSVRQGGRVILCGDDRQLAPIIRGRYSTDAGSLFGSVFEHFAGHFPRLPLRESRRMNQPLIEYPRHLFYPGLVSMCPEQRIRLTEPAAPSHDPLNEMLERAFLQPEHAVVFCTYNGVQATARNPFEAALAARLTRLARERLADPATGEQYADGAFAASALAIISPHRAQNSAILAELLAAGFSPDALPVVDTVERMQGNEREMIIVSYAVADREYAEREAEFLLNPNRFNVSITRPRAKLIVLMSQAVLDALPQDEATLTGSMAIKGYREHCRDEEQTIELSVPGGGTVRARCHYRRLEAGLYPGTLHAR